MHQIGREAVIYKRSDFDKVSSSEAFDMMLAEVPFETCIKVDIEMEFQRLGFENWEDMSRPFIDTLLKSFEDWKKRGGPRK